MIEELSEITPQQWSDLVDRSIQKKYKHINLMPFQWQPFNGDTLLSKEIFRLFAKYRMPVALELGTCLGSSTIWMSSVFESVITSEINHEFAKIANERFTERNLDNITLYQSDSRSALPVMLPTDVPVLIFIDSHWGPSNPLLEELDIIAQIGNKNVVLVIHDFKVPGHPELGWDEYKEEGIVYEWSWIEASVDKIYGKGNYNFYYNSEAIGAKRGVVFIEPKN